MGFYIEWIVEGILSDRMVPYHIVYLQCRRLYGIFLDCF